MEVLHALWWCFLFLTCVKCIPQSLLYEYATYDSQNLQRGDDVSSSKVPLKVPIVFYGVKYDSIYVSTYMLTNHRFNSSDCLLKDKRTFDRVLPLFYFEINISL